PVGPPGRGGGRVRQRLGPLIQLPVRGREIERLLETDSGGGRPAWRGSIRAEGVPRTANLRRGEVDGGAGVRPRVRRRRRCGHDRPWIPAPPAIPPRGQGSPGVAEDRQTSALHPRGPGPLLRPRSPQGGATAVDAIQRARGDSKRRSFLRAARSEAGHVPRSQGRDPGLDRPPDRRALLDVLRPGAVLFDIAPCPWLWPLRTGGPSETGFWAYGYPFAWVSRRSKGEIGRASWRESKWVVGAMGSA